MGWHAASRIRTLRSALRTPALTVTNSQPTTSILEHDGLTYNRPSDKFNNLLIYLLEDIKTDRTTKVIIIRLRLGHTRITHCHLMGNPNGQEHRDQAHEDRGHLDQVNLNEDIEVRIILIVALIGSI